MAPTIVRGSKDENEMDKVKDIRSMQDLKNSQCPVCKDKIDILWINFDCKFIACVNEDCKFPFNHNKFGKMVLRLKNKVQKTRPASKFKVIPNSDRVKIYPDFISSVKQKVSKYDIVLPEFISYKIPDFELKPIPDTTSYMKRKLGVEGSPKLTEQEELLDACDHYSIEELGSDDPFNPSCQSPIVIPSIKKTKLSSPKQLPKESEVYTSKANFGDDFGFDGQFDTDMNDDFISGFDFMTPKPLVQPIVQTSPTDKHSKAISELCIDFNQFMQTNESTKELDIEENEKSAALLDTEIGKLFQLSDQLNNKNTCDISDLPAIDNASNINLVREIDAPNLNISTSHFPMLGLPDLPNFDNLSFAGNIDDLITAFETAIDIPNPADPNLTFNNLSTQSSGQSNMNEMNPYELIKAVVDAPIQFDTDPLQVQDLDDWVNQFAS